MLCGITIEFRLLIRVKNCIFRCQGSAFATDKGRLLDFVFLGELPKNKTFLLLGLNGTSCRDDALPFGISVSLPLTLWCGHLQLTQCFDTVLDLAF